MFVAAVAPAPPPAVQSVADLEAKLNELLAIKESTVANNIPVQGIDARLAEAGRQISGAGRRLQ